MSRKKIFSAGCNLSQGIASKRHHAKRGITYHRIHPKRENRTVLLFPGYLRTTGVSLDCPHGRLAGGCGRTDARLFYESLHPPFLVPGEQQFLYLDLPHCLQHRHVCPAEKEHELLSFDNRMWNSLSDTEVDETLNTDDEVQIEKLQRALTRLTSDEKALVTLFYEEEKPVTEIAYILHLTENNVKVKLHRVRKKLCTLMKEED